MATSFPGPNEGGDKTQSLPKMLLVWVILGVVAVAIVAGVILTHNHGGTSAGGAGQPADRAIGPQLGTEGPAPGRSLPAGGGTPGTAGARTGGASSGAPAGPSAGAPGTGM